MFGPVMIVKLEQEEAYYTPGGVSEGGRGREIEVKNGQNTRLLG